MWIRDVELRYTGRGRYDQGWVTADEIEILTSLISSLPMLVSLNIAPYHWYLEGWAGLFAFVQMLPAKMDTLGVRITYTQQSTWNINASALHFHKRISAYLCPFPGSLSILSSPRDTLVHAPSF